MTKGIGTLSVQISKRKLNEIKQLLKKKGINDIDLSKLGESKPKIKIKREHIRRINERLSEDGRCAVFVSKLGYIQIFGADMFYLRKRNPNHVKNILRDYDGEEKNKMEELNNGKERTAAGSCQQS